MLLVVAAMLLAAWAPGELSTLSITNKVIGKVINIKLNGIHFSGWNAKHPAVSYYLTALAPSHVGWTYGSQFDIHKDIYDVTIYLCDTSRSGTLNMMSNLRMVFPTCYTTVNSGEPGMEKVDLINAKPGTLNTDTSDTPGDGIYPYGWNTENNGSQIWWRLDWFNHWNGGPDVLEPFTP
jgi:hypothetical protein